MTKKVTRTAIDEEGLRYKSKAAGTIFKQPYHPGLATRSCFLCGKHLDRSLMRARNLMGKSQLVCAPSCKELAASMTQAKNDSLNPVPVEA